MPDSFLYTAAPHTYDVAGVRTLKVIGHDNQTGHHVRLVQVPEDLRSEQALRYFDSGHRRIDSSDKLAAFTNAGVWTITASDPGPTACWVIRYGRLPDARYVSAKFNGRVLSFVLTGAVELAYTFDSEAQAEDWLDTNSAAALQAKLLMKGEPPIIETLGEVAGPAELRVQ